MRNKLCDLLPCCRRKRAIIQRTKQANSDADRIYRESLESSFRLRYQAKHVSARIPNQWEQFMETNARWRKVPHLQDSATVCEFETHGNEFVFGCHWHNRTETMILAKGSMTILTASGEQKVGVGEAVMLPPEVSHIVTFHGPCAVILAWTPPFGSGKWEASVLEEEVKNRHKPEKIRI